MVALPNPAPPPRPLRGRAEIEAAHRLLHEEHARLLLLPSPTFLDLGRLQVVANMLQPLCWILGDGGVATSFEQSLAAVREAQNRGA